MNYQWFQVYSKDRKTTNIMPLPKNQTANLSYCDRNLETITSHTCILNPVQINKLFP